MRSLIATVFAASLLAAAVGCGKSSSAGGGSAPGIDGTYVITSLEVAGEKMPETEFTTKSDEERTVTITGDKFTTDKGKKTSTIKVDASKSPAEIDVTEDRGGKSETTYAIYKLDGDVLTICGPL